MTGGEGGGHPKVELNAKFKKIPILGQSGTLKKYIHVHIKHGTLKNTVVFLFNRITAILFIIHGITHFTFMLLIYVSFNFYRYTSQ